MPLEFRGAPDWLIQEYANRKQPAEIANEGLQQGLNTYAQMKTLQQEKQNEAIKTYINAFQAGGPQFAQDVAKRVGLQNAPSLPTAKPSNSLDQQGQTPVQGPILPGVGLGMAAQQTPSSGPIIDYWNQSMNKTSPNQSPDGPSLFGNENPEDLLNQGAYGIKRLAAREQLQKLKDAQSSAEEKRKPQPVLTQEEALAAGQVPPNARIFNTETNDLKDQRRTDAIAKATTDFVSKHIDNHPVLKSINNQQMGLNQVNDLIDMVRNGNTVASSAMGTKMARAMGEVGVLTESDIKRYVQSGKLAQGAADTLSKWMTGKPTNATLQEISQISDALKDSFDKKVQPLVNQKINLFARNYNMTPEQAAYQLSLDYNPTSSNPKNISSQQEYEALPPGSTYIWNGQTRRKK